MMAKSAWRLIERIGEAGRHHALPPGFHRPTHAIAWARRLEQCTAPRQLTRPIAVDDMGIARLIGDRLRETRPAPIIDDRRAENDKAVPPDGIRAGMNPLELPA